MPEKLVSTDPGECVHWRADEYVSAARNRNSCRTGDPRIILGLISHLIRRKRKRKIAFTFNFLCFPNLGPDRGDDLVVGEAQRFLRVD